MSEQRQLTIVMFSLQAEQSKLLWSLEVSEWNTRQLIRVMLGLQAENSLVILGLWVENGMNYSYTLGLQADMQEQMITLVFVLHSQKSNHIYNRHMGRKCHIIIWLYG